MVPSIGIILPPPCYATFPPGLSFNIYFSFFIFCPDIKELRGPAVIVYIAPLSGLGFALVLLPVFKLRPFPKITLLFFDYFYLF